MQTFRERLLNNTATPRTSLGCVIGADLDHRLTSVFGFIRQHSKKIAPTRVPHALGNMAAAQAIDVQILDGDKSVASDQFGRNLVMKVAALVGNILVQAAYQAGQFAVFATIALATSAAALQNCQLFFGSAKPARVVNVLAGRERGKRQQTHVYANIRADNVIRFVVRQFQLKAGVPVAEIVPLEHNHLNLGIIGNRAMLEQSYQTNVLDIKPALFEADTVTIDVADRLEPTPAFEAGVARFLTGLDTAKERLEGFIQTAQGLLDRRVIEPRGIFVKLTQLLELVGLVGVVETNLALLPRLATLLQGGVVKLAVNLQNAVHRLALLVIRVESELVTQQHLLARLLLDIAADCFSRYVARRANVVTASPQRRQATIKPIELFAQFVAGMSLEAVHDLAHCQCRRELGKQVYVVGLNFKRNHVALERLDLFVDQFIQPLRNLVGEDRTAILWAPHQVVCDIVNCVPRSFGLHNLILAQKFAAVKYYSEERRMRHSPPR